MPASTAPDSPVDYQRLFRSLPDNFLLMKPDATIVDNTDSHVAASLKSREEAVGRTLFEAYPSVDQNQGDIIAASHEHVRQHLEPHAMPVIRYDLARPAEQGGGFEEMYWQATHYPLLDEQGNLEYILQRTQNITAQHRAAQEAERAQAALAESQDRTRFVLENLPVLIWTANAAGDRDFFNQRWLAFTGRTAEEQMGMEWSTSIHPDDRERVLAAWKNSVETGTTYQVEYRLRRHDGQYRWVLVRATPRRDAQGAINLWVGGGTDIHEQRQMVQELLTANETQAELAEQSYQLYQKAENQRETFHNLFMQAPAMICILRGPEHRYEFVNPVYQQIFPHRELLGHTVAEVLPEVKDQGIIEILDKVYQTGETFFGNELKLQLERDASKELKDTYFNFTYQQFRENGEPAGITVFAYEVTDLVRARQALERLGNAAGN
ncbi:PAS domain-containing protein [Hymenobacter properus]|uniref:histidine kinase n=1 Tax=Hymenobacter properus TaxID=2791026 RepID=A0A931BHW3_9BACT|nr:PAS domain-containing protein [Hymenobacter properus]MBF9144264.1 PAS domain-containing protein [Hymenobacter properus]MBR7723082.1 PAS domain-containing protein [Microvirga sp. SRT04]